MTLNLLIDQVRAAAASRTSLRIRGGGSKDFYGQSLEGDVLDTRYWSGIISYEPSELVVTARAGTPLVELEAALAEKGQCLPFEPPHYENTGPDRVATVGGMVASALSGPARASAGGVRDYMLGVQIINGPIGKLGMVGGRPLLITGKDLDAEARAVRVSTPEGESLRLFHQSRLARVS